MWSLQFALQEAGQLAVRPQLPQLSGGKKLNSANQLVVKLPILPRRGWPSRGESPHLDCQLAVKATSWPANWQRKSYLAYQVQ